MTEREVLENRRRKLAELEAAGDKEGAALLRAWLLEREARARLRSLGQAAGRFLNSH